MAVPRKFVVVPTATTRELWRIAESGELDELLAILPSADVNARNEHGMTALMRAARQGRTQMVRTLLEHGADPNLVRNDNFTALSLAAFFGHTEIVELLLGRGAQTNVETRYGTSPKMWATARSFGDVARCLEKRPPTPAPTPAPTPTPTPAKIEYREPPVEEFVEEPVPKKSETPVVVRTLSDPPEIWDLVHEAPRNFNARSAFVTRLSSMKMATLVAATALLVVLGVGTFALALWKGAFRSNNVTNAVKSHEPVTAAPVTPVAVNTDTQSVNTDPQPANTDIQSPNVDTMTYTPRRSRPLARSRTTPSNVQTVNTIENAQPPTPPAIDLKVDSPAANESAAKTKTATPLSPQMISPPKTSQPKAKVIQWP